MMSDAAKVDERVTGNAKAILDRFALKGLKEAGGDETRRFEAKLVFDGKVVTTVANGGTGGPNESYFTDREVEKTVEALADEWEKLTDGLGFETLDSLVEALIVKKSNDKMKARYAKRGYPVVVLFHVGEKTEKLPGTDREHRYGGTTYEMAGQSLESVRAGIEKKYPGARIEII